MGKQNMTLEDILNEYAPSSAATKKELAEPEKAQTKPEQSVQEAPAPKSSPDISDITEAVQKRQYKDAFAQAAADRNSGKPHYASRRPPMTVDRSRVSFIQSSAMEIDNMPMRVNGSSTPAQPEQEERKPLQPVMGDTPKIRRMSDSTRAKEMLKRKKRKKRGAAEEEGYTYDKERPEGEYLYTQIHGAKKARHRKKVNRDDVTAFGTETLHLNTLDVVPVAQIPDPEPVQPVDVEPAPRAEKTSINLSSGSLTDADSLDIDISRTPEEAEEETKRQQQLMSDRMELENAADIRSDIAELREAISFRIMALTLVMLISGFLSFKNILSVDWMAAMSDHTLAGIQTVLGFASAVVCYPVLKNGFKRLVTFHADTDSLAAVALTSCLAASFSAFVAPGTMESGIIQLYMPCAVLVLLLHSVGKLLIVNREETNLRLAAKRCCCYGLRVVEDENRAETITRGVLGDFPILTAMRRTDCMADFRKYTYSADISDRFCRPTAPICVITSAVLAILLTFLKAQTPVYGLMVFSMFASVSGCAAITFVANLPMYKAIRRMVRNDALMLGYQSVDDFYDTNSMMFDAASMFPDGSVKLAGVKMFSTIRPEESLLAAASLSFHAGSVLSGIFKEVLAGKPNKLYPVENYVYEDSMGLCGWINNQRVLLGNRELMLSHNIEGMPAKNKEAELLGSGKEAVYLSVSGNLSAMFLVELTADPQVQYWAKHVARRGICMILHSADAMITIQRVSTLFDIPPENIKILPAKLQQDYAAETAHVENMSASMACSGTFSGMAQLVLGAKAIRRVATIGIIIQAVSILLGITIVLMEEVLSVGLSPVWMLLLQGIGAAITLLAANLRRIS